MSRTLAIAAVLTLAGFSPAQTVTLPAAPVTGPVGLPFLVKVAGLDGDCADWLPTDPGIMVLDLGALLPPGTPILHDRRYVFAREAGTFHLRILAAKSVNGKAVLSDPAVLVVVAGDPPAPPGPNPPDPPAPPDDADTITLTARVRGAYTKENAATRAKAAATLATLYRSAAANSKTGTVFDPSFKTWDELLAAMVAARIKLGVGDNDFLAVRRELGDWFDMKFPRASGTALDDAGRKLAAAEFNRVARALGGLK